jgi:SAM-dependent methyltransferase
MSSSDRPSFFKRFARLLARPVARPIDGRVADVNRRVGDVGSSVARQDAVLRELSLGLKMYGDSVAAYTRAASEATSFTGVELRRIEDAFHAFQETSKVNTDRMLAASEDGHYRRRLAHALDLPIEKLDGDLAHLLNHATGHRGFAAQANLWFNPPVVVELSAGNARLSAVNERIVEVPFSMAALGRVSPPARILDIGSAESTFPLSAASLGYRVTALDLRPLPYSHPNLESFAGRFEDWEPHEERFDAAFLISTIEHVGVGAYGEPSYGKGTAGHGADRAMVERLGELLVPGGLLVITTPYGVAEVNELERTYDDESLDALVEGWKVLERHTITTSGGLTWMPGERPSSGERGVAMLVAASTPA